MIAFEKFQQVKDLIRQLVVYYVINISKTIKMKAIDVTK